MNGPIVEERFGDSRPVLGQQEPTPDGEIDLGRMMRAIRRQLPLILVCASAGAVIAAAMIVGSVASYTAVETVLLDEERADLLSNVSPVPNAARSDSAVQSEIEIIKSQELAYRVVDRLNLDEDEDFLSPPVGETQEAIGAIMSLTDPLARLLSPPEPSRTAPSPTSDSAGGGEEEGGAASLLSASMTPRDRAAYLLRNRLSAQRVGRSFVIQIGYRDFDPFRAAQVARAYGQTYERFQLEATSQVAGNAADWLRERLDIVEQQSLEASAAVQQFRSENDLMQVRGNLLTEQQQSELASELVSAAAATAEQKARLDSMTSLLERAEAGETVIGRPFFDGESQTLTEELRREYLNTRVRYEQLLDRYGLDHPQVMALQAAMDDLQQTLLADLRQAAEGARARYNVALSREQSLQNDLEASSASGENAMAVRGRLEQLEARSETYNNVYRQYLEQFELATQQQGFPIASVKVITPAEVPRDPSSPQKKAMLFAGTFLGGFIGIMIAALRELRAKPVRTATTLRREVGIECAGLLPVGRKGEAETRTRDRTLERLVQTCEQLRSPGRGVLIGVAPLTGAHEGEDDLITALAARLARGGRCSVLVIDDSRATATPEALRKSSAGYVTVSTSSAVDVHAAGSEASRGDLDVPIITRDLRNEFDVVLLRMPPLSQTNDSDPNVRSYDATILCVPWGKVLPSFVYEALKNQPVFGERLVTSVLEGAELKAARRYMSPGSYEERETYA